MSRYIDADEFKQNIKNAMSIGPLHPIVEETINKVLFVLDKHPTADVRENKQGEWIPFSEKLPERGQSVLLCDMFGDIYLTHMASERLFFDQWGGKIKDIRAWMPLPKPYEEGES